MRSYEAARSLFSFLGFCSWGVIILGAVIAFGGMSAGSSFGRNAGAMQAIAAATPGVMLAMLGFFGLALVQMGRASVDSAEYGQQSLQVAREQLEVSRQSLQQGKHVAATYAAQAPPKPLAAIDQPDIASEQSGYGSRVSSVSNPATTAPTAVTDDPKAATAALAESRDANAPQIEDKKQEFEFAGLTFKTQAEADKYAEKARAIQRAQTEKT
ncbi:MAG: hypothetical protein AAF999_09040 [Pseudomonadota bacterium]